MTVIYFIGNFSLGVTVWTAPVEEQTSSLWLRDVQFGCFNPRVDLAT